MAVPAPAGRELRSAAHSLGACRPPSRERPLRPLPASASLGSTRGGGAPEEDFRPALVPAPGRGGPGDTEHEAVG